jgi:hypothetical protein
MIALLGLPMGTFILSHASVGQINFSLGVLILIISLYYFIYYRSLEIKKLRAPNIVISKSLMVRWHVIFQLFSLAY